LGELPRKTPNARARWSLGGWLECVAAALHLLQPAAQPDIVGLDKEAAIRAGERRIDRPFGTVTSSDARSTDFIRVAAQDAGCAHAEDRGVVGMGELSGVSTRRPF
jgi:hypothetical protein